MFCLQIDARSGHTKNLQFRVNFFAQLVRLFVKRTQTETVPNPFNTQSKFTALHKARN